MNDLQVVEYQSQRVLTTAQLAEAFGTDTRRISENFVRNGGRYVYGKHYFALEGEEKRLFLNRTQIADGLRNAAIVYLWTEKGAWMVAKSLNTDRAWEAYERLVDDYYRIRQQLPRELSRLELIDLARESELARLEAEKRQLQLQYALQEQAPKVALYDTAMNAANAQPVGTVAKSLGVGPNKLFRFLREQKVLMGHGSRYNQPYQKYLDAGYFAVREVPIVHTSHIENKPQTLVTPPGIAFIHRLLVREGILSGAELTSLGV